ncbi:MAG TPA: FkbM family methyltransferase [Bacillota bacterium]|nr:FkbM family methyltransferase [Bacillota bacterium]
MKKIIQGIKGKTVIVFGAGDGGRRLTEVLPADIAYYVDNSERKHNTEFMHSKVYSPSRLLYEDKEKIIILVASMFYDEIRKQLIDMGFIENTHFFDGLEFVEQINNCGRQDNLLTMRAALKRVSRLNIDISTVIDIGASNGMWTRQAAMYFPEAFYFMIEARKEHEEGLAETKKKYRNSDYILAAAGDNCGEIFFNATEDLLGGAASHNRFIDNCIVTPMVTVDTCVDDYNLQGPFLLKLDTHGFEIPIFRGAEKALKDTKIIVVEAYNYNINGGIRFHELCDFMEQKGFRCIDIADPMHRPRDNAFWQMDLFFISKDHPIFLSNSYY